LPKRGNNHNHRKLSHPYFFVIMNSNVKVYETFLGYNLYVYICVHH